MRWLIMNLVDCKVVVVTSSDGSYVSLADVRVR